MYQFIIVIHVLLGMGIIGLVLMQQGKGADAGAAFGSATSGSVFGAQGAASFLSRTTAIFASLFFVTSLGLAILGGSQGEKVDLMDVPSVEDIKEDVPLVSNDGSANSVPSIQDRVGESMEQTAAVIDQTAETVEQTSAEQVVEAAKAVANEVSSETAESATDATQ